MRGEPERECLSFVRATNLDDSFFGMSFEDRDVVKEAISTAKENKSLSEFPDYICKNAIIEHFQVTSSSINRNGSAMARELSEVDHELDTLVTEYNRVASNDLSNVHAFETNHRWHSGHSHEKFVNSFKKGFEKHIVSLEKYGSDKGNVIFLIEYSDSALRMDKQYPEDLMQDISYGDLIQREDPTYRISRDSEILQYLFDKKNLVDYVIFVNNNQFGKQYTDIIKTANACELIKLLGNGYVFHCAMVGTSGYGVMIHSTKQQEL